MMQACATPMPALMRRVARKVARLSPAEVHATLAPARMGYTRLRLGTASADHHCVVHTAIAIADAVEELGVVRGLASHWAAADAALAAVWARANAGGAWRAPTLRGPELSAIDEALDLHAWQLRQLSAGELNKAVALLIARTQSAGKPVLRTTLEAL